MSGLTRALAARAQGFLDRGVLDLADVHAPALVAPRFGEADLEALLGLAFALRAPRVGHAGVRLVAVQASIDAELLLRPGARAGAEDDEPLPDDGDDALPWPADVAAWEARTLASPMVGAPEGARTPFVLQQTAGGPLLLTRRMFEEQRRVADALRARADAAATEVTGLEEALARLFSEAPDGEGARAVRLAARGRLAIVAGGPGTGKTYSLSRLLVALREGSAEALPVALAAPTGKAAARMREALASSSTSLPTSETVKAELRRLPATTVHRLVGLRPDGSSRQGPDAPIPAQVVVVDEASMVDLALMRRLIDAVHPDARLVLLGDPDQLASVEAGCVLSDLVRPGGPLERCVQRFTISRRFRDAPDIGLIAAALQSSATAHPEVVGLDEPARLQLATAILAGERRAREAKPLASITHLGPPERPERGRPRPSEAQLERLARPYLEPFTSAVAASGAPMGGYAAMLKALLTTRGALEAPQAQRRLLDAFGHYRVLAVHRRGPLGVEGLERALAARVREVVHGERRHGGRYWVGRPLLITQNAPDVGLLNGDIGLVLPTATGLQAVFPGEAEGEVRAVALPRLPPHEGAFAMTVHKAQGSEFLQVALVLAGGDSPIQTRELVYTGITRTKDQLAWVGDLEELARALERRVVRASGLPELLRDRVEARGAPRAE
jgi:exodeoxyribonuclease V alpha subunit